MRKNLIFLFFLSNVLNFLQGQGIDKIQKVGRKSFKVAGKPVYLFITKNFFTNKSFYKPKHYFKRPLFCLC